MAGLEVLYQIGCYQRKTLLSANQRLNARPFPLEPFLFALDLFLGQISNFGVDLGLFIFVEFDPGKPTLVIDRNRRAILNRTADIINVEAHPGFRGGGNRLKINWLA